VENAAANKPAQFPLLSPFNFTTFAYSSKYKAPPDFTFHSRARTFYCYTEVLFYGFKTGYLSARKAVPGLPLVFASPGALLTGRKIAKIREVFADPLLLNKCACSSSRGSHKGAPAHATL
jgi:hypothetical protein